MSLTVIFGIFLDQETLNSNKRPLLLNGNIDASCECQPCFAPCLGCGFELLVSAEAEEAADDGKHTTPWTPALVHVLLL